MPALVIITSFTWIKVFMGQTKRGVGRPRAVLSKTHLSTREDILIKSSALFAKHGFKATTTRMIAESVGIRQPSLFNHFRKKGDILEALVSEAGKELFEYLENLGHSFDDAESVLFDLVIFDVTFLMVEPFQINKIMGLPEVNNGPLRKKIDDRQGFAFGCYRRVIQAGVDSKVFDVEDVDLATHTIMGMEEAIWSWYDRSSMNIQPEVQAKKIARMVINSLKSH